LKKEKYKLSQESFTHSEEEASRTPNGLAQNRTSPHSTLSLKQQAQRTEKEY
jgi:hypothetical protein